VATIVCDLDGVIAKPVASHTEYSNCEPNQEVIGVLHRLVRLGHEIVIHTARWEVDRGVTESWLRRNSVPYSKVVFDKPLGQVYIDDRALLYSSNDETRVSLLEEILGRLR
jgi:histidinol phosphatase-like enzyme